LLEHDVIKEVPEDCELRTVSFGPNSFFECIAAFWGMPASTIRAQFVDLARSELPKLSGFQVALQVELINLRCSGFIQQTTLKAYLCCLSNVEIPMSTFAIELFAKLFKVQINLANVQQNIKTTWVQFGSSLRPIALFKVVNQFFILAKKVLNLFP